jgi:TatD DNase family protein
MPHRGSLNTPAQIPNILRFIAAERSEDLVSLTQAISENANRIFGSFQP